jgi:tRNA pseudouridine55 synthase
MICGVDGLLVVDKPAGWTSHDVVARCRKRFGLRRVGHGGTLDPDATGVLLVGLGRATRLLRFLAGWPKSYTGEVVLGIATSTLDASGDVTGRWDMSSVTVDAARRAAQGLTGTISQVPPMVSAIHVSGRRLHQLAREGVEVERPPRMVTVSRFSVEPAAEGATAARPGDNPVFAVQVECSSGTYVRSLAADLGAALGGGGHLRNLRRTAVGPFRIADAVRLDAVSVDHVLAPIAALRGMPTAKVDEPVAIAVGHGRVLGRAELGVEGPGPWAVIDAGGELLAVYEPHRDGRTKPVLVLTPADSPASGRDR